MFGCGFDLAVDFQLMLGDQDKIDGLAMELTSGFCCGFDCENVVFLMSTMDMRRR